MKKENTLVLNAINKNKPLVSKTMNEVYDSLKTAGYNPVDQLIGYILSGDPSYITSLNNSRQKISRIGRDQILEELVKSYFVYF